MKTIIIQDPEIRIELDDTATPMTGSITTMLHVGADDYDDWKVRAGVLLYNSAVDSLEAMILEHTLAGVNVESEEYIEGIRRTLKTLDKIYFEDIESRKGDE